MQSVSGSSLGETLLIISAVKDPGRRPLRFFGHLCYPEQRSHFHHKPSKGHCSESSSGIRSTDSSVCVCVCVCVCVWATQLCPTLQPHGLYPPGSSVHGNSSGKNTGVSCHSLLQASSRPRDRTQISCIADSLLSEPPGKEDTWQVLAGIFLFLLGPGGQMPKVLGVLLDT